MNYEECLRYLADLGHELRGVKFDLVAIQRVLAGLGQPHLRYPTAIVAGTNGKGSTCAMLASILHCAGIRAGLYTSPHLVRVNERIQVGRQEIADEAFADSFTDVAKAVEQLLHQKALPQRPSFFEFLTATAFLHFAREQVDFAVLEVGMGGRLDATNVTEPRVAIITNVELDHQEFLGNTRAAIAREKAGIIKPHRPVIWGGDNLEAAEVIRRKCREVGAELLELPRAAEISNVRNHEGCFTFDLALSGSHFRELAPSLAGRFQIQNATAAVAAALSLRQQGFAIPIEAIDEGLHEARWPGRLEVVQERPRIVLDGAHNPAAAEALSTFVREQFQGRQVRLIYASMRDKAIEEISDLLFPLASEVYLTQTPLARAAQPEEILQRARCRPERVVIEPVPGQALEAAIQASAEEDVILVAGSLFLVGAIEHYQQERRTALEQSSPPLSAMRL
ncbi:MAG TPA: folylpolyglutamate synthase/dihydrofolate synthase family protein [Terriglobia bacterium]|nr:folylpolyglutamate synthase/dihydrofolate synthase family protein [Terriglobia bacterium]